MTSGRPARVVLTGFMGAGKTTVGPLVARRLGWDFLDLDDEIIRETLLTRRGELVNARVREFFSRPPLSTGVAT